MGESRFQRRLAERKQKRGDAEEIERLRDACSELGGRVSELTTELRERDDDAAKLKVALGALRTIGVAPDLEPRVAQRIARTALERIAEQGAR